MVEHPAVNRQVAGSSPAFGAIFYERGKYPSGSRGAPAKGVDRVTGARVRIPPSPPRPVGQVVKTPPFHGGNTSSNLVRVIEKNARYNLYLAFFIYKNIRCEEVNFVIK